MKKFLLIALQFVLLSTSAFAQKQWSEPIAKIKGENRINITVDYSKALMKGQPSETFIASEKDWDEGVQEIYGRMLDAYNKVAIVGGKSRIAAGNFPDAKFSFKVVPTSIADNGNTIADVSLIDNTSGETLYTEYNAYAKGGKFGTFINLTGDAMENMGKYLAYLVVRFANLAK